jgi:hypothetical protein
MSDANSVAASCDARALIRFHEGQHEQTQKFNNQRKDISPNMTHEAPGTRGQPLLKLLIHPLNYR